MPPYSSTTMAMCDEPLCSSRSSSSTGFDSGTNTAGRASDDAGASSIASCCWRSERPAGVIGQPADDVLEVEHAAQVVHGVADERDPGEPGAQQQRERLAQRGVLGRGHHVRARHHDLAGERVPQLEDGPEHLPLLVLDDVRLADALHHVPQLVLVVRGGPGPGSPGAAQPPGHGGHRQQHARQPGHDGDGVPAAERARAGPHQQERHETADGDRDEQHRPPRQVRRRDDERDADRRRHLGEQPHERGRGRDPRGVLGQHADAVRRGVPLGEQLGDRGPGDADDRHLAGGQRGGRDDAERRDQDQQRDGDVRHRDARNVSSSRRWSANISFSSSGSAWS